MDGSLLLFEVSWSLRPLREATTANAFFIVCLSATAQHSYVITTLHGDVLNSEENDCWVSTRAAHFSYCQH